MQLRHKNREMYFHELATTSRKYFMPYIRSFKPINKGLRVMEIGCGDGGNLLPFAQAGCNTLGIDIAEGRINDARIFFQKNNAKGEFIANDIFKLTAPCNSFDLIICHDVIEHIDNKQRLLAILSQLLTEDGIAFLSFPAWQMPFGGHQQICHNRVVSHLPFIHLLPHPLYNILLKTADESKDCIDELMSIRKTRTPIELFEKSIRNTPSLAIANRTLWLINPHYETKFGLCPHLLPKWIATLPHIRNYFTTSCFYILKKKENNGRINELGISDFKL